MEYVRIHIKIKMIIILCIFIAIIILIGNEGNYNSDLTVNFKSQFNQLIMFKNGKTNNKSQKENNYYSANISLNPYNQHCEEKDQNSNLYKQNRNNHASQSILIEKENAQNIKHKKKSTKKKNQMSCQSILKISKKKQGLQTYSHLPINLIVKQKKQIQVLNKDARKFKKKKKNKQDVFLNNYKINFSRSNSFIVFSDKDTTMNNTLLERIKINSSVGQNRPTLQQKTHKNIKKLDHYKQLIQSRAAIVIQKNWRGYLTRKLLQQYINDFEPKFISQLNAYKKSAQISSQNSISHHSIKQFENSMSSIRSHQNNILELDHQISIENSSMNKHKQSFKAQQERHEESYFSQDKAEEQFDSIDSFKRQNPILGTIQFQQNQRDAIINGDQDSSDDCIMEYDRSIQKESDYENGQDQSIQKLFHAQKRIKKIYQQEKILTTFYVPEEGNTNNKIDLNPFPLTKQKINSINKGEYYDLPRQINANGKNNTKKQIIKVNGFKQQNAPNNKNYYLPISHCQNNLKIGSNGISSRITTYVSDSHADIQSQNGDSVNYQCFSSNYRQDHVEKSNRNHKKSMRIHSNLYTVRIQPQPQDLKKQQLQEIEQNLRNTFDNKKSGCVQAMKELIKNGRITFQQFIKRRNLINQIVSNGNEFIQNVIGQVKNANKQMEKICFQGECQNQDNDQNQQLQQEQSQNHHNQSPDSKIKCSSSAQSQYYTIQLPTEEYSCKKVSPIQEDKYEEDQDNEDYGEENQDCMQDRQKSEDFYSNTQNQYILNQFLYSIVQEYSTYKLQNQQVKNDDHLQFLCEYLQKISSQSVKTIIDRCFIQFAAELLAQQYNPIDVYQIFKNMVDGSERIIISSLEDQQNQNEQKNIQKIENMLKNWLQQLQKWEITVIQEMPSGMESSSFLNTENISLAQIRQSFCYKNQQFQYENQREAQNQSS